MAAMTGVLRDGWRLAVGTVTVLPVAPPTRVDLAVARVAMVLAPAAFVPVAVLAGGFACAGAALGLPAMISGVLAVAVVAWLTRAIHLDGLADTADGLGVPGDRERALAVMRGGDVGPMGVVALVLVVLLQVAAAGELAGRGPFGVLQVAAALVASRAALAVVARRGVPAARPDGLGAAVAGSVPGVAAALLWVGVALLLAGASWVAGGSPLSALAAAVAGVGAVLVLVAMARRRLGGVTGDVFGAAVEVCAAAVLVTLTI
jgi:adenosylcobinamide-GDP ribazoletransferase